MTTHATLPLRRTLLGAAAVLLALVLVLDRSYQAVVVDVRRIERDAVADMREHLYALQLDFPATHLGRNIDELGSAIVARASFRNARHVLATDVNGQVVYSTRRRDIGQPYASVIDGLDAAAADRAMRQGRIEIRLIDGGDTVAGYAPLALPPRPGEVRAGNAGLIYYAQDLAPAKAAPWAAITGVDNLLRWLGVLALMLLLLGLMLQAVLFRPLRRLQGAAEGFAAGNWSARSDLAGHGELAALGRTFDQMAEQIEKDRAELIRLNAELEQRVAHRTAQLESANEQLRGTQRALIEAAESARAANDAKSQFLANMSHELRTPLNAILGFAQLMARDPALGAEHRHRLQTINHSGQHLLGLINDVLEISRIEAGCAQVTKEQCQLDELFESLAEMARMRAEGKGLALHLDLAPALPRHVVTDAAKLRQILLNLLTNAIKFTEHGEIRLAAASEKDGDATYLLCTVADTGIGIEAEAIDRVFDAFYQTSAGARRGEGTGLGLAICRQYATLLGGSITASSTPGLGSMFRLRLPVDVVAAPSPQLIAARRVQCLAPGQPAFDILVVEDNPGNRDLLQALLEQTGFRVRTAGNGEEALRAFQTARPDLIWMDMRMPVMDGFEATRRLRALPGGLHVPIVALTASAFEEDRALILAAGCDEVHIKPLDENAVFAAMARQLGALYVYAEENDGSGAGDTNTGSQPASFAALPATLRQRLQEMATALDGGALRALAAEVAAQDPAVAAWLQQRIDAYRFDDIARALDAANG